MNKIIIHSVASLSLCTLIWSATATAQGPSAAPATTPSATAPLPEASEIFAKAITAAGGADLIRQQTSRLQISTIEMPAQGIKGAITTKALSPHYLLVETRIPGLGTILQGVTNGIGWSIDPLRGPALMTADELAQVTRDTSIESELNPALGFDKVEVLALEKFHGTPAYKVRFTKGTGGTTRFYAVDSGHVIGALDSISSAMGTIDVQSSFKDFTQYQGRTLPKVQEATTMGQMQRVTIDSIDFAPLDSSQFTLPKEIQALVAGKAASPPAAPVGTNP